MNRYKITLNGKTYEVEVEEMSKTSPAIRPPEKPSAPPPPPTPAPAPKTAATPPSTAQVGEGRTAIKAPMPGTILDIKVSKGDKINLGQVLMILEAMKMENEIPAPVGGIVTEIAVKNGDTVRSSDLLVIIE